MQDKMNLRDNVEAFLGPAIKEEELDQELFDLVTSLLELVPSNTDMESRLINAKNALAVRIEKENNG